MLYQIIVNHLIIKNQIMEKNIMIQSLIEDYFKKNNVKDVTDMTSVEIAKVLENIGLHAVNKLADVIATLTIAELYDMQSKSTSEKTAEIKAVETPAPKKRGRKPGLSKSPVGNYTFYKKRSDIPNSVDPSKVYVVSYRKDGMHHEPRFVVMQHAATKQKAKSMMKTAYAKHVNTNYLNVNIKQADSKSHRLKPTAKFFGDYLAR